MKRIFLIVFIIFAIILSSCAAKDGEKENADNETVIDSEKENVFVKKEILHRVEYDVTNNENHIAYDDFCENIKKILTNENSKKTNLDVPVYYESELLFHSSFSSCWIGEDHGYYSHLSSLPRFTGSFYAAYPTSAIRLGDEGLVYTVHDTETGYRQFTFFSNSNNYLTPIGFSIVIKEVLPHSDFSVLKVGDPIEKVEKIDSATTLYKRLIKDVLEIDYDSAKVGLPITSIHYLKEGLLRIEYSMLEDGQLVISRIEFNEDHIMTDILGNEIDYTINELDLPN